MAFPQINSSKHEVGGPVDASEFPRIEKPVSYEEFFLGYLLPNRPCIFSSVATADWQSRRDWVLDDGTPNFNFFKEHFGEVIVPVADCGKEEYSAHPKQNMRLEKYIEYIQQHKQADYSTQDSCLYLKDWHFTRDCSEYQAYTTPIYFSSDWLNEFWDTEKDQEDDYRFVYIGPKGSWTSFHADVFRSYSWSANICGSKKWIFFPPGEEDKLKDKFGHLMYNITEEIDESKFPNAKNVKKLEIIQESGEIIFVPSGWHHQVMNLVDTISINHNWINGCGIMRSWIYIKASLVDVEHQIDDCRDMENWYEHCQLILKASSGIDYSEFFYFMSAIARHRIDGIKKWGTENNKSIVLKQFVENDSIKTASLSSLCGQFSKEAELPCKTKAKTIGDVVISDNENMSMYHAACCVSECYEENVVTMNKQTSDYGSDYSKTLESTVNKTKTKPKIGLEKERSNDEDFDKLSLKGCGSEKARIKEQEFDKLTLKRSDTETKGIIEQETKIIDQSVDKISDISNKELEDNEKIISDESQIDLLPKDNEMSDEDYEIFWRFINLHHAVFDLKRVKEVLQDMKQDPRFQKLDDATLNVDELLYKIDAIVDAYS